MRPFTLVCAALLAACTVEPREPVGGTAADPDAAAQDRWLADLTMEQRNRTLERQFAGFSQSMWEVGYRYTELYFAIRERNWDLAEYHAEKIGDAIERGIERRPGRAENARLMLLDVEVPSLLAALDTEDADAIEARFEQLTNSCNVCHEAEDVPFIRVGPPERRLAPISPRTNGAGNGDRAAAGNGNDDGGGTGRNH